MDDRNEEVETLRHAFAAAGWNVEVRERLVALTASAEGGAFFALVIAGPAGFLARFGQLQAERTDEWLRKRIARIGSQRQLIVTDGTIDVAIEGNLPAEAYRQLEHDLPAAPSGRLIWDSNTRRWRDSLEGTES